MYTDNTILFRSITKGAKVEIIIPTEESIRGRVLTIKDEEGQASQYPITVKTTRPATINKRIAMTIQDDYGSLTIYCNGSNWFKI